MSKKVERLEMKRKLIDNIVACDDRKTAEKLASGIVDFLMTDENKNEAALTVNDVPFYRMPRKTGQDYIKITDKLGEGGCFKILGDGAGINSDGAILKTLLFASGGEIYPDTSAVLKKPSIYASIQRCDVPKYILELDALSQFSSYRYKAMDVALLYADYVKSFTNDGPVPRFEEVTESIRKKLVYHYKALSKQFQRMFNQFVRGHNPLFTGFIIPSEEDKQKEMIFKIVYPDDKVMYFKVPDCRYEILKESTRLEALRMINNHRAAQRFATHPPLNAKTVCKFYFSELPEQIARMDRPLRIDDDLIKTAQKYHWYVLKKSGQCKNIGTIQSLRKELEKSYAGLSEEMKDRFDVLTDAHDPKYLDFIPSAAASVDSEADPIRFKLIEMDRSVKYFEADKKEYDMTYDDYYLSSLASLNARMLKEIKNPGEVFELEAIQCHMYNLPAIILSLSGEKFASERLVSLVSLYSDYVNAVNGEDKNLTGDLKQTMARRYQELSDEECSSLKSLLAYHDMKYKDFMTFEVYAPTDKKYVSQKTEGPKNEYVGEISPFLSEKMERPETFVKITDTDGVVGYYSLTSPGEVSNEPAFLLASLNLINHRNESNVVRLLDGPVAPHKVFASVAESALPFYLLVMEKYPNPSHEIILAAKAYSEYVKFATNGMIEDKSIEKIVLNKLTAKFRALTAVERTILRCLTNNHNKDYLEFMNVKKEPDETKVKKTRIHKDAEDTPKKETLSKMTVQFKHLPMWIASKISYDFLDGKASDALMDGETELELTVRPLRRER